MAITRSRPSEPRTRGVAQRLLAGETARDVAWALITIACASILLRLVLATVAHAPVVFSDELGYEKLAQSIGQTGHLALFGDRGLSYSPLYPAFLAPIFAAGASAPTAYALIKVVNAVLMSMSIFPMYKIARFVLPVRSAIIAAALSAAAPLMFYASFSMSENLAYPVCLLTIWAMLATTRTPSIRNDALLLGGVLAAVATRVQLVMLVPAALTAILLAAALDRSESVRLARRLGLAVARHILLFGVLIGGLGVAGAGALAGKGIYSVFGRYAEAARHDLPSLDRFLEMFRWHLAGVDLAVGVVPFIAAIVTAVVFARRGFRGRAVPFAAVAVSVTVWALAEVAVDAAIYDLSDIPRIHERFLIYVFPFFLVALLASVQIPAREAPAWLYVAAGAAAALLLLAIPYGTVINQPSAVDTFGLQPLAHTSRGLVVPLPHTALVALAGASVLAFLFVQVRGQLRATVILISIPLLLISGQAMNRIAAGSTFARSVLPARSDWVDAAKPKGPVVLVTGAEEATPALETAYANNSISRLYYLCRPVAGHEFGERQVTIDAAGRFHGPTGPVAAAYAVVPTRLAVQGRIVARTIPGREVLVRLPGNRLSVPPELRGAALGCGS